MSIWKYNEDNCFRELPAPDWFAAPEGSLPRRAHRCLFDIGTHRALISNIVNGLGAGEFALPPWQRGSVWTEAQRVKMLDSIMRGYTLGSLTLWLPPLADGTPASEIAGCPVGELPRLVVDGQQRLTTLAMAARGELDRWRWTGTEWTTRSGFMTPSMALSRWANHAVYGWARESGKGSARSACDDLDRTAGYEITTITMSGELADMLNTYERLATCGTPHTVEELEIMRRWAAETP